MDYLKNSTKTARINGKIVEYDVCDENSDAHKGVPRSYLGSGTVYKIDGLLQLDSRKLHFWRLEKDEKDEKDGERGAPPAAEIKSSIIAPPDPPLRLSKEQIAYLQAEAKAALFNTY